MRLDTTSTTSSGTTTRGPSRKRKSANRNGTAPATEAREPGRGERATETAGSPATNGAAAASHGAVPARTNGAHSAPEKIKRRPATRGRTRILPEDGARRRRNGTAAVPAHGVAAVTTEAPERRLTAAQLQLLERRLLDERERALRAIWAKRGDIEDHRETGSLDEVEMDIRMAERHSEFITLIDGALRRLRDAPEEFDVSEVSGARIPFERLEIVPWTRRLTEETDPFPG